MFKIECLKCKSNLIKIYVYCGDIYIKCLDCGKEMLCWDELTSTNGKLEGVEGYGY